MTPYTRALGRQSRPLLFWEVYRCRKAGLGFLLSVWWEVLGKEEKEQGRWSHVSPQQESLLCPADHDLLFLLCRNSSAAGRTGGASSASRVQAAGLGSATQQQQPQVAQTKAG